RTPGRAGGGRAAGPRTYRRRTRRRRAATYVSSARLVGRAGRRGRPPRRPPEGGGSAQTEEELLHHARQVRAVCRQPPRSFPHRPLASSYAGVWTKPESCPQTKVLASPASPTNSDEERGINVDTYVEEQGRARGCGTGGGSAGRQ